MKKSLLLLSAALMASSVSFAAPNTVIYSPDLKASGIKAPETPNKAPMLAEGEEQLPSLIFSYAEDPYTAYSFRNTQPQNYVYLAFEMKKEDQAPYIGNKITSFYVTTGTSQSGLNLVSKVDLFVTTDLSTLPEFQTGNKLVSQEFAQVKIDLNEPYTITGEEDLYIGYRFKYLRECFYLPVDGILSNEGSNMVAVVKNATTVPEYINYAPEIGSLCLAIGISGETLPMNIAQVKDADILTYYAPGTEFDYDIIVKNYGANDINTLTIRTEINNGFSKDSEITLPSPLVPGAKATLTLTGMENATSGGFTVLTSAVKANGVDIENPVAVENKYNSYTGGYPRRVVVEEGTGTWCQWCPRGIVMMEYLEEHYPKIIRIAVHTGDEMQTNTYNKVLSKYFSQGVPSAIANRIIEWPVAGDAGSEYVPVYRQLATEPTYVKVDMEAGEADDDEMVRITATTEFFNSDTNNKLQLAFVVIEDGVGPYNQSNKYSGGGAGPMGGWESLGNPVSTIYNDVARYLDGYPGIAESIPAEVEAGTPYEFVRDIPVSTVTGGQFRVAALVVDPATGEIINANEIDCVKSAVKGINGETINMNVENGNLIVSGAKNVSVYTLDGRVVSGNSLAKGMYIVVADGKCSKIMVK